MIRIIVTTLILGSYSLLFSNDGQTIFTQAKRIIIDKSKLKLLEDDYPIHDIKVGNNNEIWILGQRYLWQYLTKNATLRQISFTEQNLKSSSYFQQLLVNNKYIFVATDKRLYQISNKNQDKIFSYNSLHPNSLTLSLKNEDEVIHWFLNNNLQTIHKDEKRFLSTQKFYSLKPNFVYLYDENTIFSIDEKSVFMTNLNNKKSNKILTTQEPLLSIHLKERRIRIISKDKIFVLSHKGKFLQTIPVINGHYILKSSMTKKFDYYLFNDFVVERKDSTKKTTEFIKLPLNNIYEVQSLDVKNNTITLLADNKPFIFKILGL